MPPPRVQKQAHGHERPREPPRMGLLAERQKRRWGQLLQMVVVVAAAAAAAAARHWYGEVHRRQNWIVSTWQSSLTCPSSPSASCLVPSPCSFPSFASSS